ncbi:MAG: hypothetical protein DRP87_11500 [Spirochaetes bacterium]|nr:MAG: hypothetical protein DRP87_11500 [Spirochaetota bacterium]
MQLKKLTRSKDFNFTSRVGEEEILRIIGEIKEVFENHFDRTWFAIIIDDLPMDSRTLPEIRNLVSITTIHPGDEKLIRSGIQELEQLILNIKRYLLPVLKEALGISAFVPHKMVRDKTQYIIRKFVLFTFPFNLERLAMLTSELKRYMNALYPEEKKNHRYYA